MTTTAARAVAPGAQPGARSPHRQHGASVADQVLSLEMREVERTDEVWAEAGALLRVVPRQARVLRARLELVVAACDTRRGDVARGAGEVRRIRAWAETHGERLLQARAERQHANLLRRAGEMATSLEHALVAVSLLRPGDPLPLRTDHLLGLADSLACAGAEGQSLRRYLEALHLAEELGQPEILVRVVNNLAYTYFELGRTDDALPLCDRMIAMEADGFALPPYAVSTLADVLLAAGLPDRAGACLDRVSLDEATPVEDRADLLLARGRVARAVGRHEEARGLVAASLETARDQGMGEHEVRALRELSEISADLGDWQVAYRQLAGFHEQYAHQFEAAAESRARMVQALFEVGEARRESEAYRELSYRDALTGLRNRRFVEEELDALVTAARERGTPLTVAFVDLDHFKLVNDHFSHDLGDQVLTAIGRLLLAPTAAVPGAVAARMGGEEFLLVLPGLDLDAARERVELLRATIQAHPWEGLAAGLRTTISAGLAELAELGTGGPAELEGDRAGLLRTADRRLYAAKAAGRNLVVVAG